MILSRISTECEIEITNSVQREHPIGEGRLFAVSNEEFMIMFSLKSHTLILCLPVKVGKYVVVLTSVN